MAPLHLSVERDRLQVTCKDNGIRQTRMTLPSDMALQKALEEAFDALCASIDTLCRHVDRHPPQLWCLPSDDGQPRSAAAWLREALTDMWYHDGQDGRATRNYVGVVAADEALMALAEGVNRCKDHFGEVITQIRTTLPADQLTAMRAALPLRPSAVNAHLCDDGLARLHLKQCWRRVLIAPAPVARIRLAWYSNGRSIKRLSVQDAEKLLMQLDTSADHVRIQYRKLAALPSDEPLAQVQAQAPLMRANLFYVEPLDDGRQRQAMNIAMPLFVPSPNGRLPHCNQPPAAPPETRTRARRSDSRIDDEPWLPSIRVHRYHY